MTDIGVAALTITQGVSAFQAFLPPLAEVRKATTEDKSFCADVRVGEIAAAALTVGIGAMVSSLTGDPIPTYVGCIVALGLFYMYETTLRRDRPLEPKLKLATFSGPVGVTENGNGAS